MVSLLDCTVSSECMQEERTKFLSLRGQLLNPVGRQSSPDSSNCMQIIVKHALCQDVKVKLCYIGSTLT